MATTAKAYEASEAVKAGADEVDMVLPVGHLIAGDMKAVHEDISKVVDAADGRLVKVILETCYLNDEQKVSACVVARLAGAHFVKTSTGFGTGGATVADVSLMRRTVGDALGVKASGGIRDAETALAMIDAGASRLGVSAGIRIVSGDKTEADY